MFPIPETVIPSLITKVELLFENFEAMVFALFRTPPVLSLKH
jgi:hypothetical protein